MAAPSGIVWGSKNGTASGYNNGGRIGLYVTKSSTNTQTTVTVEVWIGTKYAVHDSSNTLRYDILTAAGSATTSRGSVNVNTNNSTGAEYQSINEQKLATYTHTYDRGTSDSTRYVYATLSGLAPISGTMSVSTTVSIPALAKYTVSYNANGGSGAPGNQTKYYGKTLTISSTIPTRTGYSFNNWALSKADADNNKWYYTPGSLCYQNNNLTLYAVWTANTYPVTYNANGGTGAPASQTKTYGESLKLSSTKPTRTNYNFLGWATSATATTVTYAAGGTYTANSAVTLYAVWELAYVKPRINVSELDRCTQDGTLSDGGTYARLSMSFTCDRTVREVTAVFESDSAGSVSVNLSSKVSGQNGNLAGIVLGNGTLSTEVTYTVKIKVADEVGSSTIVRTLPGYSFTIDCLAGGNGISFGKPAELEGVADIAFKTRFSGGIQYVLLKAGANLDDCHTPGFYIGESIEDYKYGGLPTTLKSGTFTLEVLSMGNNNQIMHRLTQCHLTKPAVFERMYYETPNTNEWSAWTGEWCKATITGTFEPYNPNDDKDGVRYRKTGRVVEVRGIIKPTQTIPATTNDVYHEICRLPEPYRPDSVIYTLCQGSGTCTWLLRIEPNGQVLMARYRDGTGYIEAAATDTFKAWLPLHVTYVV